MGIFTSSVLESPHNESAMTVVPSASIGLCYGAETPPQQPGLNVAIEAVAMLSDGVRLPYSLILDNQSKIAVGLIFGHGLGARDPHSKSHLNDEWSKFMESMIPKSVPIPAMLYTARGHGDSDGWMLNAALQGEQFRWDHLSHDMHEMAMKHANFNSFIATGSSMGSATALFCAMQFPKDVQGVIMIRPPTAWEDRKSRRHDEMEMW